MIGEKQLRGVILLFVCAIALIGCGSQENGKNFSDDTAKSELHWNWVVDADKYTDIFFADEEVLAVKNDMNKWALITMQGEELVPFEYDTVASFQDGASLVNKGSTFLFINRKGEVIGNRFFEDAQSFGETLACVKSNGLWGYIDSLGNHVISCQFEEAKSFSGEIAAVGLNGKWGYIDKTGRMITDYIFDEAYSFCEELAVVAIDDKYGVIDKTGKVLVDCQYDMIDSFSEGYAAVKQDGKWGFIDSSGKICIALQYDKANDFSEGKAAVMISGNEGELDQWAYIDTQGAIQIDYYPYEAAEGRRVVVGDFRNGVAFVSKALYCIIDEEGNDVFDGNSEFFISALSYNPEYNVIPAYVYLDEKMTVKKYGLMGLHGEERIEPVFDYIYQMKDNYVIVSCTVDGVERKGVIELHLMLNK